MVLSGDIVISLAGVDLVQVQLRALIASVRADLPASRAGRTWGSDERAPARPLDATRLETDPESVARDLMKLVLTIVELVRQLMEAQAFGVWTRVTSPSTRSRSSASA